MRSPEVKDTGWRKTSQPGQIFVMDTASGEITTVVTADEVNANTSLDLTRTGVVWGNGSGNGDATEYYLNASLGKIFKVGKYLGYSVVQADPAHNSLMWAEGSDKKTHRAVRHEGEVRTTG